MQNCLVECATIERPWGAASGICFLWIGQHIQLSPGQMETWHAYPDVKSSVHYFWSRLTLESFTGILSRQGSANTKTRRSDRQMLAKPHGFDRYAGLWRTIHWQAAGAVLICAMPLPPQAVDAAGYVAGCCGLATARHACYPNKMPAHPLDTPQLQPRDEP